MSFPLNRPLSGRLKATAFVAFCLLVALVPMAARAQVTTRPLSDFVDKQIITSGGGPYNIWTDPTTNRLISVDYTGKVNAYIVAHGGADQGTTVSGTVLERPLKDGTAEITVQLQLQNAVTWGYQTSGSSTPLVFGHFPNDIVTGADAALGTVNLNLRFHISAPGAPLADLWTLFSSGALDFEQLNVIAQGTFRAAYGVADGTRGFTQSTQTGTLQSNGKGGPRGDFYPAEHIDFHLAQ
jgi:hypothetical protein